MKKTIISTVLLCVAWAGAYAQANSSTEDAVKAGQAAAAAAGARPLDTSKEKKEEPTAYIPYGNLERASKEDIARARALAGSVVRDILQAYETRQTEEMRGTAEQLRRRADDIANATIAAERDKVLEFLGINPEADTALYYFVSWSMPLDMLRSYAIEAMWSGGTLVFKGVPPGKEFGDFIMKDLQSLVYGKGAAANISIDPRLFDAYAVNAVPTIVFTTVRANMQCQGLNPVTFKVDDQEVSYDTCPPLSQDAYWKVSGAVTSNYALETFIENGAGGAKPYLSALARGWTGQEAPGKGQKPFAGEWKDVVSPSELAAIREAAKAVQAPAAQDKR